MTNSVSARRRREVIDALRRGTVPQNGLDLLAVGIDRFGAVFDSELQSVASGAASFKAIRGEYGAGKTFLSRWLAERALRMGFAAAEVQISETQTPLHRLETVYRRICESLRTASFPPSALPAVVDAWLYTLESDVGGAAPLPDQGAPGDAVADLLQRRLSAVSASTPAFAAVLRAYQAAVETGDRRVAEGLVAWLGGQPNVAASVKRAAGVRGELDHFGAMGFLRGLLTVLYDSGHPGMIVVLDEVETLQRVRGDVRDKALNALRQLVDEVDHGRFPGLYLVITGTPAFFDGPSGAQRLPPLAQRLATDFSADSRFDNPRAVQVRLTGFTRPALIELGVRVRELYAEGTESASRVRRRVDDTYLGRLADAVTGSLGGSVGIAPRLFLKKLVGDILDRVDLYEDFDPARDYRLTLGTADLTEVERNAAAARPVATADDVELDIG
jgi:hypothetical protein